MTASHPIARARPRIALAPETAPVRPVAPATPASRIARGDPRWPRIAAALSALHARHRRALRIVDAECGSGTLLIEAARHARALGFTAIEAVGIGRGIASLAAARVAAARLRDPAIGIAFTDADWHTVLAADVDLPPDLLLCRAFSAGSCTPDLARSLAAWGTRVIVAPPVLESVA